MSSTTSDDPPARRDDLRAGDRLDRIGAWLVEHVTPDWSAARFTALARTSGGVSYETWIVDAEDPADPQDRRARFVLRRQPLRGPVEPYDVLGEAAVYAGLADTGVPVPRVLGTCADLAVAGRPFAVLEYIDGEVPDYRTLMQRDEWIDPARRANMARQFMGVLGAAQRVDWRRFERFAALASGPRPREPERLHALIEHMLATAAHRMADWVPHPIFRDAARWCQEHAPDGDPDDMVLIHGDFKVGNFIWRDERIVAFLDWEGAMVGDPLQDLGYACHPAMREPRPDLMAMLAPLDDLIAYYEAASERTVDRRRLHYYVVYALLFHTWTLTIGLPSIAEWDGDMRMATGYKKLNQVTRLLTAQIEAYEAGRGVL
ncbi:phosphotransferase family protein [Baekduia soli]|nr:phosphotransferase family protein [Baekduia soli]